MWVDRGTDMSLNRPTVRADTGNMVELREDVPVRFVGPASDVLRWPMPGEHGVVQRVGQDATHIVWERSPLVLAWPNEWIEACESVER